MKYRYIIIAVLIAVITFYVVDNFGLIQKYKHHQMDGAPMYGVGSLTKLPDADVPEVKPGEIVELSDGDVFELEATIVKQTTGNRTVKRLAYNGQIPGPVLKVQKGSTVTVNFTNNIDMETTVHSHGLRQDWKQDGTPGMSQDPVKPGETYTYELSFPDTGVYWYHPHIREDYQQELGLYGNFIVEEENYWNEVEKEEYLIMDDFLEDGDFNSDYITHTLMGRYGDSILINDRQDYSLNVETNTVTRLFITNVANTRTFDLHFDGSVMKLVGGDNGRIENEIITEEIHPAPSERYVVELFYRDPAKYPITHRGEQIGTINVEDGDNSSSNGFTDLRSNPEDYSIIRNQEDSMMARLPDKEIRLTIEMGGMMDNMMPNMATGTDGDEIYELMGMKMTRSQAIEHCQIMPQMQECRQFDEMTGMIMHAHQDGIEWEDLMPEMNAMSTDKTVTWIIEDKETGNTNMDINWKFAKGEMVKVRIFNDPDTLHPMQHPIHFHGQRFVVLARDDVLNNNLQWKDTVLIPLGQTVDLMVDMSNPGMWMGHCHIAEHLHSGMMFHFSVE